MKCQILFSEKNKKNVSICRLLKFYPKRGAFNVDVFLEQDEEKGIGSAETDEKLTCPFTHFLKYSRPPAEVKQALTTYTE